MVSLPVHQEARRRLREAQRAETQALNAVTRAQAAHARVHTKLDAADASIAVAVVRLVAGSGVARAAQLLGVDVSVIRRMIRAADGTGEHQPPSSA